MTRSLMTGTVLATAIACGAPVQSSNDIDPHTFEARTLGEKVAGICTAVQGGSHLSCQNAGQRAITLGKDELKDAFSLTLSAAADGNDEIYRARFTSQFWLGNDILFLAQRILDRIAASPAQPSSAPPTAPGNGLIHVDFTFVEKPAFDPETTSFHMRSRIRASGAVEVDNTVAINGSIFNGNIVATLRTTADAPFESSLVKGASGIIVLVPHAADVYVETALDLRVHSIGLENLVADQIMSLLSEALTKMSDLVKREFL